MLQLDHIRLQRPYRLFCHQIIQAPYREAGGHVQKYRCILKTAGIAGQRQSFNFPIFACR